MKRVLLPLLLVPGTAFAHTGHAGDHPFLSGLTHPAFGTDHLLAMVAVGLWAAVIGGRAMWALPVAFVSAMLLGGLLGSAGAPLPVATTLRSRPALSVLPWAVFCSLYWVDFDDWLP